jgi:hypothetical protein
MSPPNGSGRRARTAAKEQTQQQRTQSTTPRGSAVVTPHTIHDHYADDCPRKGVAETARKEAELKIMLST